MNRIYIWGTGNIAEQLVNEDGDALSSLAIKGFIDNSPSIRRFHGWDVYPPSILENNNDCSIYIAVNRYEEEIKDQIRRDYPQYAEKILDKEFFKKLKLLQRYRHSDDPEIQEIISYLKDNPLGYFNYEYITEYTDRDLNIAWDDDHEMFYFIHGGKKVYLSRAYKDERNAKRYVLSLYREQDRRSPHRYITETFDVQNGDIVVDAGGAEGFFSIDVIDKASKIYIFEPDEDWCEALRLTFAPYSDKVQIICKCLSDYVDYNTTSLDAELEGVKVDFIKMDIEGEEYYALKGAKKILESSLTIKCAVCTYHQEFAYFAIRDLLEEYGFSVEHSNGYMWVPFGHFAKGRNPVLRRGLIYAIRQGM